MRLRIRVGTAGLGLSVFLCLLSFGCASVTKYPVQGTLAGQAIATTIDSELSKYYLEHYLRNNHINPAYDQEIDRVLAIRNQRPLDSDSLRELTQEFSPDFATLYFVSRVYQDPINRKAQDAFHAHVATLRAKGPQEVFRIAKRSASYLIVFVPGYAYMRDPTTGADFAQQRRLMTQAGFKNVLIETDELATVDTNAKLVASEILRLNEEHRRIILVSTSKGGTEVALAIGKLLPPERLEGVKAWISIGGLLRGTPSADQALQWPKSWLVRAAFVFTGHRGEVIEDLSTKKRREVFAQLEFPGDILTLQYVGVPLSGQIAEYVQGRYDNLKDLGPNDGLTLLADELVDGGIVITDIGLDHYYLDPEIDLKTFALASVVLDLLEGRDQQHRHPRPAISP
jgi:hypothetical protein